MIKAVIFDIDGTILESEDIHYEVEAETLRRFGIPATKEITKEYLKKGFPPAPYAEEVLSDLRKKYILATATMGERHYIGIELKKAGFEKYFKVMVFGEEVSQPKPDPEIFLKAAKLLGFESSECLVIEDSLNGVEAAKKAGMLVIARKGPRNKHRDFKKADFVIDDLREIPKILTKL